MSKQPRPINDHGTIKLSTKERTMNDLNNIPAAACGTCGGWTSYGGMSQHSESTEPVSGRTGCTCHTTRPNKLRYPFIRMWGRSLGSFPGYILQQVEKAQHEGAPWNAIYRSSGTPDHPPGEWVTVDDLGGDNAAERQAAYYRAAAQQAFDE